MHKKSAKKKGEGAKEEKIETREQKREGQPKQNEKLRRAKEGEGRASLTLNQLLQSRTSVPNLRCPLRRRVSRSSGDGVHLRLGLLSLRRAKGVEGLDQSGETKRETMKVRPSSTKEGGEEGNEPLIRRKSDDEVVVRSESRWKR